ncbi:hypothetical protein [Chroococcus sp. FPU101]|uniref:GumC family protein n=1 Tax=Chroococcus sp. FPU101 TaxID=1974212 RepID=UPI001A8D85A3|nr:hypothetical protein [Chroococcus sp. FPU101]GFE70456.1 hypothetical protein CFPU101_30660 [Chroococcus sp. FPU101]
MNPTDSTHSKNHQHQIYSRPWQFKDNQFFGYQFRLLTAVTLGVMTGVCWWLWQSETKYIGKFYLLLAPIPQKSTNTLAQYSENELELSTQTELLQSSQLLKPILAQYPDLDEQSKNPLIIKRLEQTPIVEITLEDQDPYKIEQVLKQLATAYLSYKIEATQTPDNQQSGLIKKELSQINQRLSQSQKQLDTFQSSYSLYNPEQQTKLLAEQLAKLEMESYQTKIQLQETTTLYQTLEQQLKMTPEQAIASTDLSESPYYQNLVKQLQEVKIELAQETTIFLDASPNIQALKEKQKNLQTLIEKEEAKILKNQQGEITINSSPNALRLSLNQQYIQAANQIQVLQSREAVLKEQIENLKSQIKKIPVLAHQYAELQQKIKIEKKNLNQYLESQNQLKNETTQSPPWQLLSSPQLSKTTTVPTPQKNLILGLFAGSSLGLIFSLLIENLFTPLFNKKN